MPSEDIKILDQKLDKALFIIYAELECLIENIDICKNNPQNSFTTKRSQHISSGFSITTISSFKSIENKDDVYKSKDCMKKFCEFLREHAMNILILKGKTEVINKRPTGII